MSAGTEQSRLDRSISTYFASGEPVIRGQQPLTEGGPRKS